MKNKKLKIISIIISGFFSFIYYAFGYGMCYYAGDGYIKEGINRVLQGRQDCESQYFKNNILTAILIFALISIFTYYVLKIILWLIKKITKFYDDREGEEQIENSNK